MSASSTSELRSRTRDSLSSTSSSSLSYGRPITRDYALPLTHQPSSTPEASPPLRTLDDVRAQTAQNIAVRAIHQSELIDGTKVGVVLTLSHTPSLPSSPSSPPPSNAPSPPTHTSSRSPPPPSGPSPSSSAAPRTRSSRAQASSSAPSSPHASGATRTARGQWTGFVRDVGRSPYDEAALWDVVRKAARSPMEPLVPPPGSCSIAQLLERARARLERIGPQKAYAELRDARAPWPVVLVDIRPAAQRAAEGGVRGAVVVERNVLEWRFDPRCAHRLAIADRYDLRVILMCQEGYTSSLAAAALHDLGLLNATDVVGGYVAWKEAGLPFAIEDGSLGVRVRGLLRMRVMGSLDRWVLGHMRVHDDAA
ncbi:hypothetical protein A0H81_06780 [Grifola frondosa]|uniref:Rhodanese domain-containing protein n=1 Tax=Grifola frondosa TaxID=5627 RepID=A0A1C7M8T7_GRIFR|nr:hypothetical protein A0H81_06780 [Grifola frondosa]